MSAWVMGVPDTVVRRVDAGNSEPTLRFLIGWVVGDGDEGFRSRGIPLVHQIIVAEPFRRRGVATALMDAAEQLARDRGVATLGITVGLFDEYGPAQRLYARRGYVPDGRGACQGQRPLSEGVRVTMNHDLIMWLTKDLAR
jgi:GNAT superfamily N-acetyltransferase